MIYKIVGFIFTLLMAVAAHSQVSVFTEHQIVYMYQHGVNKNQNVQFPTGDLPYIGRIGLEYKVRNLQYQFSYIHRSNLDLVNQDEYNYNGLSLGLKYTHCVYKC